MKVYSFPAYDVKVHEKNNDQLDVLIKIKNMYPKNITVSFVGAAPGKTNLENVSAKTLPFLNREDAYDNTPNKGTFTLSNKVFCFGMLKPNSYYTDDKKNIVPPYFTITLSNDTTLPPFLFWHIALMFFQEFSWTLYRSHSERSFSPSLPPKT